MHRYELIRTPEWQTYAESGQVPAEGERVFVKYNVDSRWYRGHIDEVKQVTTRNVFQPVYLYVVYGHVTAQQLASCLIYA